MSITEAIRDHLKDNEAVAAIVEDRVYESFAQFGAMPYVTIDGPHTTPVNHQKGASARVSSKIQIDCWEKRSRGCAAVLGKAVREALLRTSEGTMGDDDMVVRSVTLIDGPSAMDQPATDGGKGGLFRDMQEFLVWHEQSVPSVS